MDFFQAQDTARRNTTSLILFFALAVLSLVIITNLLVMVLFGFLRTGGEGVTWNMIAAQFDWQVFLLIGVVVSLVILGGSVYKTVVLSGGGSVVARSLGGRLLQEGTNDLHERKALNVVEEMAIASGTPVPQVYLLDNEQGINAFAAGFTTGDAVVGLTRGAIMYLTREELQGVIAHEFSHILHGDMRLNIRLMGVLHGILLIGLIGYFILRSVRGGSSRNTAPIFGLGLGLMIIGYAGTFFGNLIKASVSRQREFLADASAVQFTRNNSGISGALKKIGGYAAGSTLSSPQAPSMSHAYFSVGINAFLQSVFATHPPLTVRIKRIDPHWDGNFVAVTRQVEEPARVAEPEAPATRAEALQKTLPAVIVAGQVLDSVGQISAERLDYAAALVRDIPTAVRDAVHEPFGARAVIYCLVIDRRNQAVRERQMQRLGELGDSGIRQLVDALLDEVQALDVRFRLPLINMALPALRQLSAAQYALFRENLAYLMKADDRINLFEWALQRILFHHLERFFSRPGRRTAKYGSLQAVKQQIEIVLSMLVHACVAPTEAQRPALDAAQRELGCGDVRLVSRRQISIENLESAIDQLASLKPLLKPRLLKACLAIVTHDQNYAFEEMELMRAIGDAIDCPVPPYLD